MSTALNAFDPLFSLHVAERRERRRGEKHPEAVLDAGSPSAGGVFLLYVRRLNTGRNRRNLRAPILR
jgi:hypothetical protein